MSVCFSLLMSFQEEPADVCLDWARVFPCQYLSGELNWCKSVCLSANVFSGENCWCLLWIKLVFFLVDVFLVSSIDAKSVCLSANVFSGKKLLVSALDWARVFSCWCLSGKLNQCLARSVSQCLLPIYLKGSLDVFQDQPNVFLPSICLMGLISV